MQAGKLSKYLKGGAIWGFIVLELIFFSRGGRISVGQRQGLHGRRQHAAAAQAVGTDRHHRHGHDDRHGQRQYRPVGRGNICDLRHCPAGFR